jgi:hypothetical protein
LETDSDQYWVRTEKNVLDSDGTLILYCGELRGGTQFTYRMAIKHNKRCLLIDLDSACGLATVRRWVREGRIRRLNVAGPRESSAPGITRRAFDFLCQVFDAGGAR